MLLVWLNILLDLELLSPEDKKQAFYVVDFTKDPIIR